MSQATYIPTQTTEWRADDQLLGIVCACGMTLFSTSHRGLVGQVASHWRMRHPEPVAVTPDEFVRNHAFAAWEAD